MSAILRFVLLTGMFSVSTGMVHASWESAKEIAEEWEAAAHAKVVPLDTAQVRARGFVQWARLGPLQSQVNQLPPWLAYGLHEALNDATQLLGDAVTAIAEAETDAGRANRLKNHGDAKMARARALTPVQGPGASIGPNINRAILILYMDAANLYRLAIEAMDIAESELGGADTGIAEAKELLDGVEWAISMFGGAGGGGAGGGGAGGGGGDEGQYGGGGGGNGDGDGGEGYGGYSGY